MTSRTLLVLGASGFLGPHVVRAARTAGWRVVAASRRPADGPRLGGVGPEATLVLDAGETRALPALLESLSPDAIVCAAALARVDACERDPELALRLNAAFPQALASAAQARGVRLVHVSTDLVFGAVAPRAGGGFLESDPPAPVHVYGRTKAEGEARVRAAAPSALVVRLPLLYGDSAGRGLGASDQLLAALARGERPALFTDEWRTPLAVQDAAAALVELVERPLAGLLHVAGPARLDRLELGLAVLRAHGHAPDAARACVRSATRAELGLAASRPADVSLDASRARAVLATPLRSVESALSSALP